MDTPGSAHVWPRPFSRILAATDLSELGDRAVRCACAALPRGGVVVLLHVLPLTEAAGTPNPLYAHYVAGPSPEERARECVRRRDLLRARVPGDAAARGLTSEVEVVEAHEIAAAICRAAERNNVDAICVATHGRRGLSKLFFGSVTQELLGMSARPVLLVPQPRAPWQFSR